MKHLTRVALWLLCFCILLSNVPSVRAENTEQKQAVEISSTSLVSDYGGIPYLGLMFDDSEETGWYTQESAYLTLEHQDGIGSLYLVFRSAYGSYTVTNNDSGESITAGEDLFIHEFIDLEGRFSAAPKSVTIRFENGPAQLYELDAYSPGTPPASVQRWNHPDESATDLVLFATHSDDDQLFFAGLLPYYALERGYRVQVVYLTTHFNTAAFRIHEMLNGLWAVGVTAYPVFGEFPDFGNTVTVEDAFYEFSQWGYSREYMTGFVVEQLRRFKPLVAVGHDINGEYGHTQHKVYSRLLMDAIELSNSPEAYPETVQKYGLWDVPKTYIHLYEENQIVMDWDQPMENYNGMTPYQVSKELGFACHVSQHYGWSWYLDASDTAAGITRYSPCNYGLYRTTVGADVQKNDMFENVTNYAEQERLAEEAMLAEEARLKAEEEARLKAEAEEAARLEAERLAAEEEAARLAAEQLAAEEEARLAEEEKARIAAEEQARQDQQQATTGKYLLIGICAFGALLTLALLIFVLRKNRYQGKFRQ